MPNKREIGSKYEDIAVRFLEKQGLTLVTKNYCCSFGEIDLIFSEGRTLVFVEVKYRRTSDFGFPLEAVDEDKRRRIRMTAKSYCLERIPGRELSMRFDCIGILGEEIQWIQDAF